MPNHARVWLSNAFLMLGHHHYQNIQIEKQPAVAAQ
jgi:hypothetical protein